MGVERKSIEGCSVKKKYRGKIATNQMDGSKTRPSFLIFKIITFVSSEMGEIQWSWNFREPGVDRFEVEQSLH